MQRAGLNRTKIQNSDDPPGQSGQKVDSGRASVKLPYRTFCAVNRSYEIPLFTLGAAAVSEDSLTIVDIQHRRSWSWTLILEQAFLLAEFQTLA